MPISTAVSTRNSSWLKCRIMDTSRLMREHRRFADAERDSAAGSIEHAPGLPRPWDGREQEQDQEGRIYWNSEKPGERTGALLMRRMPAGTAENVTGLVPPVQQARASPGISKIVCILKTCVPLAGFSALKRHGLATFATVSPRTWASLVRGSLRQSRVGLYLPGVVLRRAGDALQRRKARHSARSAGILTRRESAVSA
eukprot:scaffold7375_cov268-Pinguiococcus_pyrenoidosus.AAC.32